MNCSYFDFAWCCDYIIYQMYNDSDCLKRVCFSDKATFHISRKVIQRNFHIWGSQNSHDVREQEWGSLKLNVQCGLVCAGVIRTIFFHKVTSALMCCATGTWQLYLSGNGPPPHFWHVSLNSSMNNSQECGLVKVTPFCGPPQLPYLTPLDFFI